jgi:hypothetical protein
MKILVNFEECFLHSFRTNSQLVKNSRITKKDLKRLWRTTKHENNAVAKESRAGYKGLSPIFKAAGCKCGLGESQRGEVLARRERSQYQGFHQKETLRSRCLGSRSRSHDIFQFGLDLHRRQAGSIPAPAKSFDQKNAGDQTLSLNYR